MNSPLPADWQTSTGQPALQPGEVHLWRVQLAEAHPRELAELLAPAEALRAQRFHFARDRERFIAGRGLLRVILGRYLDVDPGELRFALGAHGKPEIEGVCSALRFNLSHSGDLMLLAVTHARAVGIDLELIRENVPFQTLADYYFDPEDAWQLRLLRGPERAGKFYELWTSTEARLKASGRGLGEGPRILEPDRWSLLALTPAAGYAAALAVEGSEFQLQYWSWAK